MGVGFGGGPDAGRLCRCRLGEGCGCCCCCCCCCSCDGRLKSSMESLLTKDARYKHSFVCFIVVTRKAAAAATARVVAPEKGCHLDIVAFLVSWAMANIGV